MPRLPTLKPRVAFAGQKIRAHYVERMRGSANMKRRERILSARPLCVVCESEGRTSAATEVDHVVPLWAGGSEADANLQPLCRACHVEKSARETAARMAGGGSDL